MMNLIRADFYRVSRGWVVYAPFVGLLLVQLLFLGVEMVSDTVWVAASGAEVVHSLLGEGNIFFLIALLPFVFCVSVPSFSDSTIKNDISWGMSRAKLYVSKVFVMAILALLLYLFYIGAGILLAAVTVGFGGAEVGFWPGLLQAMGAQMIVTLALCSLMVFLSFLLKKPYVLTEVLAFVLLIPMIVNIIANLFNADLSWVLYFDLTSTLHRFASLSLLDNRSILIGFGVVAVWAVVPSALGIALLRKAEIK